MLLTGLVFDLDGTLVNTLDDIANAGNEVLADLDLPTHNLDSYRLFIGDGAQQLIHKMLPLEAQHLEEQALASFRATYREKLIVESRPYDGISEMLDTLTSTEIKLAVLSNKPHDLTIKLVEALFGNIPFTSVLGQRDDIPKKPDPTACFEIAKAMGVRPSDCAFIGDTPVDVATALAARMLPVGVSWGFRPSEELYEEGARFILEHPSELLPFIQGD